MTEPEPIKPTDLQLAVLRVLWAAGDASVQDVQAALAADRPLAVSTVATVLARMQRRGWVTRGATKPYRYCAVATEADVARTDAEDLTRRAFSGDVAALICHLLETPEVGSRELEQVKAIVEQRERELREREGRS